MNTREQQPHVNKNPDLDVICPQEVWGMRAYSIAERKVQRILAGSSKGCGLDITPVVAWQSKRVFSDFLGSVATLTGIRFEEGLNHEISIREDWDRKCRTAYFNVDDLALELSALSELIPHTLNNERTGLWEVRGRLTDTDLNQLLLNKLLSMFEIPGIARTELSANGLEMVTRKTPTLIAVLDYLRCNNWPVTNWEDRR